MRTRSALQLSALGLFALYPASARAAVVDVASVQELEDAVAAATPGTVIEVAAGTYAFTAALWTASAGAAGNPITLRAAKTGDVRVDFDSGEGLVINHVDWVVEHLWINGACAGVGCGSGDAGIHIKVTADRTVIRGSRITNWGECIKTGEAVEGPVHDTRSRASEAPRPACRVRWREALSASTSHRAAAESRQ